MNTVFLSHSGFGGPFAVGSHHLADGLARRGHHVLHVVTPVSPAHLVRRRPGGNAEVRAAVGRESRSPHGAVQIVPRTPVPLGLLPGGVDRAMTWALAREIRQRMGGRIDRVVIDQPLLGPLLSLLHGAAVVYRPTDRQSSARLRRAERHLVGMVDRVVTTSEEVHGALPATLRRLPHLEMPNGVDLEAFGRPPAAGRDGVVYVGALDDRFDWDAVDRVAAALPSVPITLYGPVLVRPSRPVAASVEIAGPVAPSAVPSLLRRARLGLMPFNDDARNTGRSPMKLWEYLASGLHVLASQTPALSRLRAPGVHAYGDAAAAGEQARTVWPATAVPNTAGAAAARDHGWEHKTEQLLGFLA